MSQLEVSVLAVTALFADSKFVSKGVASTCLMMSSKRRISFVMVWTTGMKPPALSNSISKEFETLISLQSTVDTRISDLC